MKCLYCPTKEITKIDLPPESGGDSGKCTHCRTYYMFDNHGKIFCYFFNKGYKNGCISITHDVIKNITLVERVYHYAENKEAELITQLSPIVNLTPFNTEEKIATLITFS